MDAQYSPGDAQLSSEVRAAYEQANLNEDLEFILAA
jgi:hypothetical protein